MNKIAKVMTTTLAAATIAISASAMSASAECRDTAYDSQFLNDMGVCPDRWGQFYTTFHWDEVSNWVNGAWAQAGVHVETDWFDTNEYYIDGNKVQRYEAFDYAAKKLGKTYDWNKYIFRKRHHNKKH